MTSVDILRFAGSKASATELVTLSSGFILTIIVELDLFFEIVSRVSAHVETGVVSSGSLVFTVEKSDAGGKVILVIDFSNHLVYLVPEDSANTVECLVILHEMCPRGLDVCWKTCIYFD